VGGANPAVPNDNVYQTNWKTMEFGGRKLMLSKYRVDDPSTGVFLSRNPLKTSSGLNLYIYCINNPTNIADSNGADWEFVNGKWQRIKNTDDIPEPDHTVKFLLETLGINRYTKADWDLDGKGYVFRIQLWRSFTYKRAGIDASKWDPSKGFAVQKAISIAMYNYYTQVFLRDPKRFLWPGLAKVAGASVHLGLEKAEEENIEARETLRESGYWTQFNVAYAGKKMQEIEFVQKLFLKGQKDIVDNLLWQFEVYDKYGINELEGFYSETQRLLKRKVGAVPISKQEIEAWRDIDSGDPERILRGNLQLIHREQRFALKEIV
jgi:RHS repeat-associated protein